MVEVIALQGELPLDPEVEARCEDRLRLARTHMAAGFYHWFEAGKQFAAIKQDLGPRNWAPWLRKHQVAVTSADRLILIVERFDPILPTVGRMDELNFDLRALEALASPAAPPAAAEEAVKLAGAGDHITKAEAQRLIVKARYEVETKAAEEMQAKLAEQIAEEAGKLREEVRDHEVVVAAKDREIAELKLAAATAAQTERDKQAAELEGKLVVPEEELQASVEATVERLIEPMKMMLQRAEKARDNAIEERNKANARLETLEEQQALWVKAEAARAGKPRLPPLDSTLSFNAMVCQQRIAACVRELKVTPEEMIRIEIEFSTRLHDNPSLAREKLDQTKSAIEQLLPWFNLFLDLHRKEYGE